MEVTVRVCDICKERIAVGKCPICGRDVCKPDTQNISIELGLKWRGPSVEIFRESVCVECAKRIESASREILAAIAQKVSPMIGDLLKEAVK